MRQKTLLVLVLLIGLISTAAVSGQAANARIRFVHAIVDAPAIDIAINGVIAVTNLAFNEATGYLNVPAGDHTVTVTQAGESVQLWTQTISATAERAAVLIAVPTDPVGFVVFSDNLQPLSLGRSRLTAVHAIAGAPAVDILLADGRPVIPDLQFIQPYGTLDLPALVYDLVIVPAGAPLSDALLPNLSVALSSGTSHMILVAGTLDDPIVSVLTAPTNAESAGGAIRIAHTIAGAPDVEVLLNGVIAAPRLAFSEQTDLIAIASGDYSINVNTAGGAAEIAITTYTLGAGETVTLLIAGTADTPAFEIISEDVTAITSAVGQFSLINLTGDAEASAALSNGTVLLEQVGSGERQSAPVNPGVSDIIVALTIDGVTQTTPLGQNALYGGTLLGAVAVDGAEGAQVIALRPVSLNQQIASAGSSAVVAEVAPPTEAPVVVEVPTVAEPPVVVAQQPTPVPPPVIVQQPTPVPTTASPTARIILNPGANLQLRQYPSSDALSLGLAPSGATLIVIGREGEPFTPVEATPDPNAPPFVDPASLLTEGQDLDPRDTWLNVSYETPDGGSIRAWVNALYLSVRDTRGNLQRLADLPTVPSNLPGNAQDTSIQSPQARTAQLTVVITNVGPDARVHIRRTPDTAGESLALIPASSTLTFIGSNADNTWYFVRFESPESTVEGWTNSQFTALRRNGAAVTLDELNQRGELVVFGSERRGAVIVNTPATSAVAPELRDVIVGRVFNLSATANLHLRRYASAQSESLALLPVGTQLTVVGRDVTGDWLRVDFSGTFGWVFSLYVELSRNGEAIDLLEDVPETTVGLLPPGRETPLDSTVPNASGTPARQPAIGDLLPPGFEDNGEAVEELLPLGN